MALPKLLLETLRTATDGHVEVSVSTPQGMVKGIIEESFFQEFSPAPTALSAARLTRIVADNTTYLEGEVAKQLALSPQQVVTIR